MSLSDRNNNVMSADFYTQLLKYFFAEKHYKLFVKPWAYTIHGATGSDISWLISSEVQNHYSNKHFVIQ